MLAEIHRVDRAAILAVQRLGKLVERTVLHRYHIVHIAHIVNEVSIAVGDEIEALEVSELLQYLLLGDAEIDFQAVGP